MINIITRYNEPNIINDFEVFFEKNVIAKDFDSMDLDAIKLIDDAILLDSNLGTIKTKFGVTDILHLSTGCKIILSYLYIRRNVNLFSDEVLNITECGSNALDVLFDYADRLNDSSTIFLLRHSNQLRLCKDREYCVNGHPSESLHEGVVFYGTDL